MSTKLKTLQEEALAATKSAQEIAEKADAAARQMTDDEKSDFDKHMAKGRELLEQIKSVKADLEVLEQAKALADEIGTPVDVKDDIDAQGDNPTRQLAKSLGLQVVSSEQFKAAMAPFAGMGQIPKGHHFSTAPINVKTLITGASSTSAGVFVRNEDSGIVEMLGRAPRSLRDLISVRRTGSDAVDYVVQTSHTNNAAETAEATTADAPTQDGSTGPLIKAAGGGYKPEGAWAFELRTANVKTIAEWVPASKRALADVAQLEGLINDELRQDLADREEQQLLVGDGTGENLTGIRATSGIQTQAFATDIFTSVRKGITKARTVGRVNPTAILLNPADKETVDLAREGAGTGAFLGGGPFGVAANSMWGIPMVESEYQPAGFATVGDFSKAVLWDREEATVSMTDSHEDFFVRNLVAILAEERVAFAVTRPTAFVNVDVVA